LKEFEGGDIFLGKFGNWVSERFGDYEILQILGILEF
jgi:hypothetical protein